MRRKFPLCLLSACLVLGVGVADASAAVHIGKRPSAKSSKLNKAEKTQNNLIQNATDRANQALHDLNVTSTDLQTKVKANLDGINGIKALLPVFVDALSQLKNGEIQLANALSAGAGQIFAALQNPTTGLVGLNLARPQFGAFTSNGTFIDGTGAHGSSGPTGDADEGASMEPLAGGADIDGLFVVDFGNDVSARVFNVNAFPLGPTVLGGGPPPAASAVDCAASAGASTLCGLAAGGAADSSPNHVLVQFGDGSSGGPTNGFTVTAISG